jgi:hypothetical protein
LYKEDRKSLLQHCQECYQQKNLPTENNQTEVTSCLKNPIVPKPITPRSILSDKHCSEPTSPTTARTSEKTMQRNLSDLSQRIKKRVTYRLMSLNDQSGTTISDNPSGPKRQRSVSVDCASTVLCDTTNIDTNHVEDDRECDDRVAQEISIKDPTSFKKKLSRARSRKNTNQNAQEFPDLSVSEVPHVTSDTDDVTLELLNINHIDHADLQSFPGYKPKA